MPPSSRIPSLLQPHVHLPRDESIVLLTSTLGASANWLIIRFLCDALNTLPDAGGEGHSIVLVSWMREYEFWKQEARKGAALDLERLRREGRFAFIDGLSGLCGNAVQKQDASSGNATPSTGLHSAGTSSPTHARVPQPSSAPGPAGRLVPARGPPMAQNPVPVSAPSTSSSASTSLPGHHVLKSLDLSHLKTTISSAVSSLTSSISTASSQRKTLAILDNPDLLLALNPAIDPSDLTSLILTTHTLPTVSHVLLHLQSDDPLLGLSVPPQPLELSHHNFVVKCAHMSRRILGVRVLDTGVARDVSGVIRITEQTASWLNLGLQGENKTEASGKGKEFLYQVKGDGSVRVFERGAG